MASASLWSFIGLITVCACSAMCTAKGDAPDRFAQDRFAIGFWVDPPADQLTKERYAEIAEAGFTLVLGGFGARTPDTVARQIELCRLFNLRAIVATAGLKPEDLPDDPVVWGYLIRDEPGAADFPDLRKTVDAIRAARPGKLAYINLFPNYASAQALGTTTYDEHVRRFADEVDVDVLSMDHYPIMTPTADGRDRYCANLETMRVHALRRGIPHWNFFNVMPFGPHSDPTEAQLRWQVFTSLAYGSRGVLYFCYWTPRGDEFPKGGAIITADGRRTRHYDQARRINQTLNALGPTIMKLTSTGTLRVKPDADPAEPLAAPVKSLSAGDYLLGLFKHEDGRIGLLINNYSIAYTAWPTVEFAAPLDQVREVSPATGAEIEVRDDSPDMPGLQISLDAGEGRLFLMKAP
ncbi:MAG: hypothetical protein GX446_00910 [Chthonomonadales bacterium]|nr:hypothetical protein [Chthonomonadales bacterium]